MGWNAVQHLARAGLVRYFGHHEEPMDGWKLDMSWS